jgi:hypothetical protein
MVTHHSLHKSSASETALAQGFLFISQLGQSKPKADSMFVGKLLLWPKDISEFDQQTTGFLTKRTKGLQTQILVYCTITN